MDKEPLLGKNSEELTPSEKQFKVMGLMAIGFLIKRKKLILTIVVLGIVTAAVLSYIVLF